MNKLQVFGRNGDTRCFKISLKQNVTSVPIVFEVALRTCVKAFDEDAKSHVSIRVWICVY